MFDELEREMIEMADTAVEDAYARIAEAHRELHDALDFRRRVREQSSS